MLDIGKAYDEYLELEQRVQKIFGLAKSTTNSWTLSPNFTLMRDFDFHNYSPLQVIKASMNSGDLIQTK